jgi:hypothetical protein
LRMRGRGTARLALPGQEEVTNPVASRNMLENCATEGESPVGENLRTSETAPE